MSFNSNPLLKLDILEYHLQQNKQVRFPKTKELYRSKNIQTKLIPSITDFPSEILRLQTLIFSNKQHAGEVKLARVLKKTLKSLKKLTEDQQQWIKEAANVEQIAKSRVFKIIQNIFKVNIRDSSKNEKIKYIPSEVLDVIMNRSNELNPSTFYNNLGDHGRVVMSKVWSNKETLKTIEEVEAGFKVLFGKVAKESDDSDKQQQQKEEDEKKQDGSDSEDGSEADSESEEDSVSGSESGPEEEADDDQDLDMDAYSEFDRFLVASDDEDNTPVFFDAPELDENVNYNEVTDEEPSAEEEGDEEESEDEDEQSEEVDDFFQEPVAKRAKKESTKKTSSSTEKHKLPAMAHETGYISGDSDHDISDDEVVKKATQTRKNRPGQRARQKLWEKKFGRHAKHITKERNEYFQAQKEKQYAFEERKAKRDAKLEKAKQAGLLGSGSNMTPLVPKKIREKIEKGQINKLTSTEIDKFVETNKALHPSWEAKKKLKEQEQAVKFEGKKIKF